MRLKARIMRERAGLWNAEAPGRDKSFRSCGHESIQLCFPGSFIEHVCSTDLQLAKHARLVSMRLSNSQQKRWV